MSINKKLSTKDFIEKAMVIHGDRYDYSLVSYEGAHTKVSIICSIHGQFQQAPTHHFAGQGCKLCYIPGKALISSTSNFVQCANKAHNYIYDYRKVIYIRAHSKVEIICSKHGSFWQTPSSHLQGHGCLECRSDFNRDRFTKTLEEFIKDAVSVHSSRYDYSKSIYLGDVYKLEIVCAVHGSFWQSPTNHLYGKGCPKCSTNISYKEIEWLDSLGVSKNFRNPILNIGSKIIKPDAFNPNTNTIYEFYGDYWHGNPKIYNSYDINSANKKTFGQLFIKTLEREQLIKQAGYSLITFWESDFDQKEKIV